MRKLTTEEFIKRAKEVHGEKYDYSKVEYVNAKTKVIIICNKHGEFLQDTSHLSGHGCDKCAHENLWYKRKDKLNTKSFIEKAKQVHHDRYDYSRVNYIDSTHNIIIICKEHGEFEQLPSNHLKGEGCSYCAGRKLYIDKKSFIKQSNIKYNNFYNYDKFEFINSQTKGEIICPNHGSFWLKPYEHLTRRGCPKCSYSNIGLKNMLTKEEFIERCKQKGICDLYNLNNINYQGLEYKITIICNKHGSFDITPHNLLFNMNGCPKCRSSKGERFIMNWLQENNVEFLYHHKFDDCVNIRKLEFDFYLPSKNLCIEFDGIQHFENVNFSGKMTKEEMNDTFEYLKRNDEIKNNYCKENKINMLRIRYNENIEEKLNFLLE